jgi:hypothetical protein
MAIFFKKRKEAEKKARSDSRAAVEARIAADIDKAGFITDPAAKILKLSDIRGDISVALRAEWEAARKHGEKSETNVLGGSLGLAGASLALIPVTAGASLLATGPILLAGSFAADPRKAAMRKKFEAEAAGHQSNLNKLYNRASDLIDGTIEEHVKEISKSALYEDVRMVPGVAKKFADVAARQFVLDEQAAAEKEKAPKAPEASAEQAPAAPPKKKPPSNYDHLRRFGS